jgi:hypothetical protein
MRDEAVDEALKAMEGLKPSVGDVVDYVERKYNFIVPRKFVREKITTIHTPFWLLLFVVNLKVILTDFSIGGSVEFSTFSEEEKTPVGKALIWVVENSPAIATVAAILLLTLLAIGLVWTLEIVWPLVQAWTHDYGWLAELPVLGMLFGLAVALFVAKRWLPTLYGLSGIEGGLIACWLGLQNIGAQGWAAAAALAGGVYAMVSGVENVWKGVEAKRENKAKIKQLIESAVQI